MPAVTVKDVTVLPRVDRPDPAVVTERPVRSVTSAPSGLEGEGFPVRRAFAGVDLRDLDPFVHMDQMGEVEYAPGEPKGTPWHPHRGFETVTYMIDGIMEHQDSNGGGGVITNGDTQWMTAGAGILHIETPPEHLVLSGGLFHGIQLWVNLPRTMKFAPPRYQDIRGGDAALLTSPDGGALIRLIAGSLGGFEGPGSTHTPITLVHATVSPGAEVVLPWQPDYNALVYVLAGQGSVGAAGRPVRKGQLAVFGPGGSLRFAAATSQPSAEPNLDVLVLGGRPIREPIAMAGPFVMNTRVEVIQAFEDFQAGKLGTIPAVHGAPTRWRGSRTPTPGPRSRPWTARRTGPARGAGSVRCTGGPGSRRAGCSRAGLAGVLLVRRVLDERDHPGRHEPRRPHRRARPGHLGHLDHAAPGRHLDPAAGARGGHVVHPGAVTGVDHDLHPVPLHT